MIAPPDKVKQAHSLLRSCQFPVIFTGAGISAESGIATFRGNNNSYWAKFDPYQLASVDGFNSDPELVIRWYNERRQQLSKALPNAGHKAIAQSSHFTITQNVDNLLERSGIDSKSLVHLHGSILYDRCSNTVCPYEELVDLSCPKPLHRCPLCHAFMRPSVVWFGEPLPAAAWQKAEENINQCDCLLIVGTSATVYPAASLISIAKASGSNIIVVDPGSHVLQHEALTTESETIYLQGTAAEILPLILDSIS